MPEEKAPLVYEAMAKHDFCTIVRKCPRCSEEHKEMTFRRFGNFNGPDSGPLRVLRGQEDPSGYTHWGMCPTLCEPVLMTVMPGTKLS